MSTGHTERAASRYRYHLQRLMRPSLFAGKERGERVLFVGYNPSTGDVDSDDPTIRRMIGFTERLGGEHMAVVNLFAWRATDPSKLPTDDSAIGPQNDETILNAIAKASLIICCWGGLADQQNDRARRVYTMCRTGPVFNNPFCFGVTASGQPRHPLYLKKDEPLIPYRMPPVPT